MCLFCCCCCCCCPVLTLSISQSIKTPIGFSPVTLARLPLVQSVLQVQSVTTQPNSATRDAESLGRPSLLATERKTQHWFIHKGRSLTDSIDRDFEPALPPPVNQILTLSLPTILFAAVSSEDKKSQQTNKNADFGNCVSCQYT